MLAFITDVMKRGGYAGIVALMFLENIFPPIPSELIMPLAGFLSSNRGLAFAGIVLAGTAGSVLGALPLYYLGRRLGKERLTRWADDHGRWLAVTGGDVTAAGRWLERHGSKAVLFGRLIPGVRSLISIPAGIHRMHLGMFVLFTTIGAALWTTMLAAAGRLLGAHYAAVERFLGPVGYVVFGALVVAYIVKATGRNRP